MTLDSTLTGSAASDGCEIAYRIDGPRKSPALLLSNSLGATADMWAAQVPALARVFRVIRYDTRGHGDSGAPAGEYTIEQLGRDALAVLDAAGVERAHVCGLSLGGITAMWLALNAAPRVGNLVLASTAARIGTRSMWNERIEQVRAGGTASIADAIMARWFTDTFRRNRPGAVSGFRAMLASCPADGYAGCCAALRDADLLDAIGDIRVPTLVLAGAADHATPPADGRAICARVQGAAMALLNASHLANVEQPEPFNAAVLEFLREHPHTE